MSLRSGTERFLGSCEELESRVDVAAIVRWISDIDFADWPQQHRRVDGRMMPAMVNDPEWRGFKAVTDPAVEKLMTMFPGCIADTRMLSVVMPGHDIPPHIDLQSANWRCRVHVPLVTNDKSLFVVGGMHHRLAVGRAYKVNTTVEHAVTNDGDNGRIHFMFDVRLSC